MMLHLIPIVVALGACLQSIMKDQRLEERLTATNAAITKLNNYRNWWYSLTLVERRLDKNFDILVERCEAVAYADIAWAPPATKEERVGDKSKRVAHSFTKSSSGSDNDQSSGSQGAPSKESE